MSLKPNNVNLRPSQTHKEPTSPSVMSDQKVIVLDLPAPSHVSDLGNRHVVDQSQHATLPEKQMQSHWAVPSSKSITNKLKQNACERECVTQI
ncbi:hypothetical protein EJB05_12362, partial [Eragrostis curvula]